MSRLCILSISILSCLLFCGAASKAPPVLVRFHVVASEQDREPFIMAARMSESSESINLLKMPVVTEHDISAFHPYPLPNGTYGATFVLEHHGTKVLENASRSHRGGTMVAVVNGRAVAAMRIDRPVNDGLIVIPHGLTVPEVKLLGERFSLVGESSDQTRARRKADRQSEAQNRKANAAARAAQP